jgi:anaerobic magnesium-protoporphyrin IX monomethyl ester cyclase
MTGHVVLFSDVRGAGGPSDVGYVPLSLLTIGSYLQSHTVPVYVVDAQFDVNWRETLRCALSDALYFGVSALTGPSLACALDAVALVRSEYPELPIVWGGYHATLTHSELLHDGLADIVVLGAGEYAARDIAKILSHGALGRSKGPYPTIQNTAVLRDGHVALNRTRTIVDPSDLPPVDYQLVDLEPYFAANGRAIPYISSYGCPYACSFCAEPNQALGKWRGRSPRQMADDLAALRADYAPRRVNIYDPNFSSSVRRVIEFVDLTIDEELDVEKSCDMRATDVLRMARNMDLSRLRRAGFVEVYLGVESGSDPILSVLGKRMQASQILTACRLLDEVSIITIASFMHDLPTETAEDSRLTFELIEHLIELPFNTQRHHFFTPYPATSIYSSPGVKEQLKTGLLTQVDWASSSTYGSSSVWRGRPEFRAQCLKGLQRIRARLVDPSRFTLPVM